MSFLFEKLALPCVLPDTWTVSAGALQRLGLDQLLFAPFFIGTFFTCLLTLEVGGHGTGQGIAGVPIAEFVYDLLQGKSGQIKPKLQHDLLPAVIANWKLWIPFQFINFRLVPPPLQVNDTSPDQASQCRHHALTILSGMQVGFSNIIAVAWNTYLSWASHNSAASSGSDKFKVGGKDSAF